MKNEAVVCLALYLSIRKYKFSTYLKPGFYGMKK